MRRYLTILVLTLFIAGVPGANVWSQTAPVAPNLEEVSHDTFKKKETSMMADFFEKNVYERGAQWFYIPRAVRRIFGIKVPSANINVYDELPDSTFFTNRIGRKEMTGQEIISGPERNSGPDPTGPWMITKGKFEGITPGFFIKDSKGDEYIIKFDPPGSPELSSGAEAIASRMMYAFGYNVPQYTVAYFDPKILTVWEHAKYYSKSGFNKPLTMEKVMDSIKDIDRTADGRVRVSASLKVEGILKGPMSFNSTRKDDPNDYFRHRKHREIRSTMFFASWVNNHDLRKGNTLDTWIQTTDGKGYLKHYMIDFGSSLGSAGDRPKDATFTFEYFIDYKDIAFQALTLGVFEPDWKKREDEQKLNPIKYPAAGNLDNLYFRADRWKPEIPHYAFDDKTLGDAFWSTKIMMKLKQEALKEIMAVGQYSDKDAETYIYNVLVERQKLIGKYWFSKVTPLDEFEFKNLGGARVEIAFKDLEVFYNLTDSAPSYRYRVVTRNKKGKEIVHQANTNFNGSPLELDLSGFRSFGTFEVVIEKSNPESGKWNPPVILTISSNAGGDNLALAGIWHADKKVKK